MAEHSPKKQGSPRASDSGKEHKKRMQTVKAARKELMAGKTKKKGLIIVVTGDGKGKSTSAFGLIARALGWGMRVGVVQFVKGKWKTGERQFFNHFPEQCEWHTLGEGFTWNTQDRGRDMAKAREAWEKACEMLGDTGIDVVVLDELNIVLDYGYLPVAEVVGELEAKRAGQHVIVTGRNAPDELVRVADTVTEMRPVKHAFDAGIKAQKGIEF